MADNALSLVLLTLDEQRNELFHMTLVSHLPYEQALQELVGMGRIMLKNDREIARVEIYRDSARSGASRVTLTREDLAYEETGPGKQSAQGLSALLRRLLH